MRLLHFLAALAALLLSASPAAAQPSGPTDAELASFVHSFLAREVRARGIPGAAIVLVRNGRPILSIGLGVADLDSRAPIDPEQSLMRQGSISKLFTWILVMQLVEERRLDLDRDVDAYLDFRVPKRFGRPVTLRHLMTHSAGFSDRIPLVGQGHHRLPLGVRLRENMPELVYAPGQHVAYSNYGAALAAYIVERTAGESFERLVEQRIFRRAGMTDSTFVQPVPDPLAARLVANYSASARTPNRFEYIGFAPAGSLSATPADMGRFVAALLDGGRGPHGRILSNGALTEMLQLQRPLATGLPAGLGLGFLVADYRGVRHVGHGGSMIAATTDLQLLPDLGSGWTLSFSGRGVDGASLPLRQELLRAVIDRFYAARPAILPRSDLSTAAEIAGAYVPARRVHEGVLQFASLNTLSVRAGEAGELRIETDDGDTRWLPVDRDRFAEAMTGLPLAVQRDAEGRIVSLASPYLNNVTDYQPAPARLRFGLPVLLATPVLILLAVLGGVVSAIVHRFRRYSPARPAADSRVGSRVRRAAPWTLSLVLLTMLGWIAYGFLAVAMPGQAGDARWALPALQLLGLATAVAAPVLAWDVIEGWRRRERGAFTLASATFGALGAIGLAWLLLAFGLAGVPGLT